MAPVIEKADLCKNFLSSSTTNVVLKQILHFFNSENNIESLIGHVHQILSDYLTLDAFYVGIYSAEEKTIDWKVIVESGKHFQNEKKPLEHGVVSQVIHNRETVVINSRLDNKDTSSSAGTSGEKSTRAKIRSIIISPIVVQQEVYGIICLKRINSRPYLPEIADLVENVCSIIALKIKNEKLLQKFKFEKSDFATILVNRAKRPHMTENEYMEKIRYVREVGHELNQPLTGISGYCMLIKEQVGEEHPIYKDVCEIEKQAKRLEELTYKLQSIVQNEESSDTD